MSLIDGLISYYNADEASGDLMDIHGSHDLTDTNTVGSGTGILNNARDYELDRSEYHGITDHSDFSFVDDDFSMSVWVKPETASPGAGGSCIFSKSASVVSGNTGDEYALGMSQFGGGSLSWTVRSASAVTQKFWNAVLTTGSWFHIVVWHDSSANVIGINVNDGTALTAAHTTGCQDGANNFLVGATHGGANFFDGLIDEFGVWNKVLSSAEITQLYGSGTPPPYPFGDRTGIGLTQSKLLHRMRLVS